MIFHRSTRSIVNGKRRKTPSEAVLSNDSPQPADSPKSTSDAPEMAARPEFDIGALLMKKVNLPIWVLPTCCFGMVVLLVLVAVLLLSQPADTNDPVNPDIVTTVLPNIGADQSIVSVQADSALAALAAPGDVVQLYDGDGTAMTALQYVQVYQSAEDGRLLLIVDDLQATVIVSQRISSKVLLVSHDDSDRAKELLELQDRINDPEIVLTLQPEVLATLGTELKLEYQTNIQPVEAPLPEIHWESDNPDVVTVKDGTIYAAGVGNAVITASCGDAQATCSVRVSIPLQDIQFDRQTVSIAVGETLQLVAKPVPEDATDFSVTWSSEDPAIASVSEDGVVSGVAPGTVIVTASCGEISVQCSITVGYHAEVVQLDRQDIALAIGQTYKLVPTVYPSADMIDTLYFESSNSKVVTVGSDGTVTALAAGKAYITFRCGDATAKCLVTVTAAETQP